MLKDIFLVTYSVAATKDDVVVDYAVGCISTGSVFVNPHLVIHTRISSRHGVPTYLSLSEGIVTYSTFCERNCYIVKPSGQIFTHNLHHPHSIYSIQNSTYLWVCSTRLISIAIDDSCNKHLFLLKRNSLKGTFAFNWAIQIEAERMHCGALDKNTETAVV